MDGKCSLSCPCYRCTPRLECHDGACKVNCKKVPGCSLSKTINSFFEKRELTSEMDEEYFRTLLKVLEIQETLYYDMIESVKEQ